ncbi:hypothetical protein FQR65_LT20293 [Abscondita terminalis]|nr:hypothetical protein FQR65_LT20293 [Abscondita terminalis]
MTLHEQERDDHRRDREDRGGHLQRRVGAAFVRGELGNGERNGCRIVTTKRESVWRAAHNAHEDPRFARSVKPRSLNEFLWELQKKLPEQVDSNALATKGTMSPASEFSSPAFESPRNSGSATTWVGTIEAASTIHTIALPLRRDCPGHRNSVAEVAQDRHGFNDAHEIVEREFVRHDAAAVEVELRAECGEQHPRKGQQCEHRADRKKQRSEHGGTLRGHRTDPPASSLRSRPSCHTVMAMTMTSIAVASTAAPPTSRYDKPRENSMKVSVRVESPGPPPVITWIWSKARSAVIVAVTTANTTAGPIIGSTTRQNRCQALVPSRIAASIGSLGTVERPAVNSTAL